MTCPAGPPPPAHGGWTPTSEWDSCAGGHPGGSWDDDGVRRCGRCGRELDLTKCPHGMGRSYCPDCSSFDMGVVAYRLAHPEPRPLSFALRSRAARLGIELLPHERMDG